MGHEVWTFTGEGNTGTFESSVSVGKYVGIPVNSHIDRKIVLHGTGDFKGQTLKLSYEGEPPALFEGYLIVPK